MGVFDKLNSGQSPSTTGGVFGRLQNEQHALDVAQSDQAQMDQASHISDQMNFQQDQLNQDLTDKQQMDDYSRVSDSLPPVEPQRPGQNIPVIGSVLQGLDAFSENPYVDTGASILRSFYTPGAGIANVGGLSNAVNTGISKLLPGLSSTVLGRSAQGLIREVITGAPIGAGQALSQDGQLDDAAQGALYGAASGGAFGAAGPLIGKGVQAARGAAARELTQASQKQSLDTAVNDFTRSVESRVSPTVPISEGPSYQGMNLLSKADEGLQRPRTTANNPAEPITQTVDPVNVEGPQPMSSGVVQQARNELDNFKDEMTKKYGEKWRPYELPAAENKKLDDLFRNWNDHRFAENDMITAQHKASAAEEAANAETMKGNWFTNIFGNQGVGISAFSSKKRISEGPLTTADQLVKSGIKSDVQGVKDAAAAQMRSAYQNFVDYLSPLKRVSSQAYETAMDAARANNIANTIVRDKFVTPEGNVVGEGLSGIFKKVARGQDKQFIDYLTLRHAKTRMNRDERVFAETVTHNGQKMTPEVVQQRIDMYNQRHPGFDAIAKEWDQFNDNVLQHYGVNEGLISQDLYKALREKNPNYSPMRRQFSLSEKPGQRFKQAVSNSSFSGQKAPLKQVSPTGSVRDIVDPRKTTIESVGAWANAAMRNRTMQSMVDAIKRDPAAFNGVAEIVQKPQNATDLRKVLLDGGEDDFVQALNEDFKNLFKTTRVDQENIVRAMVNGEPVYLQVHDPELVKTLIGMGPQTSNILVDVLSAFSNATKRGATGMLAPVFAVKGATMDLVQSAIQAKNPPQQALYTVHAIFSGIADKLGIPGLKNLAEEFRRAGGEYSAALKGDRKLDRSISSMTRDPLLSPKAVAKGAANLVKAPFKALEAVGNIAENAPRMAAYKAELQRLGGNKSPENVRQAMSQAREITVNFSRKGAFSQTLEAAIPYNNAAVQGTYRVMRAFKENPVKTSAAVAALAVVPKLAEYAMFHDDPDYLKLPARERMRFLFVNKNDDGTFTKIPMEPAYNSIGEMTIESLRYFKDNDPAAFKDSMDALANAWLPPAVSGPLQGVTQGGGLEKSIAGTFNSTVAAPGVAVVANQSFTGAPIVSRAVADRSTQNQYDEKTSNIARRLGEITGMSPMKVDYLIRAYGGDPARLLLPLNSPMGAGNTRNTLLKNFIVDPQLTNTLTNDFYGGKKKLDEAYRDHKEVGAPLPPWFTDQLHKATTSTAAGSISKKLSILNDQKKAANANQSFTPEQRTVKLRDIQSKMNDIYMDINSKLYKQGVPIK